MTHDSRKNRSLPAAAACAVVSLILGGCVRYESHPLDPGATAQAWASRSLDDESLHAFMAKAMPGAAVQWPLKTWDVDQLTLAAIHDQPSLAVARAQWDVAKAGRMTAAQRPNPSVSASATYDTTTAPPWIPAVSFDIPIETAGKRGDRMKQAAAAEDAARWDWIGQIWQVRSNVRSAFVGVYEARKRFDLLERQVAARTQWVHALDQQLVAGEISGAESTPAHVALQKDQMALQDARQGLAQARAALADAVGVPAQAIDRVSLNFGDIERLPHPPSEDDARNAAIRHRADVLGALASYAGSQAALQAEIANQFPDVHLGPGYELDQTDHKWTLGISLPLPVLNRDQGPIAEAEARRKVAAARFVAAQAKAIEEASQALASYRAALATLRSSAAVMERLSRQYASVRQQAAAGETDRIAVLSAEIEYDSEASFRLDALLRAQQALGRLEAATQSPLVISDNIIHQAETDNSPNLPSPHEP